MHRAISLRFRSISSPRHAGATLAAGAVLALAVARPAAAAPSVPAHDHVVVVIMENKSYDEVRTQPYTASLIANGAVLTDSHASTHPSQPNYLHLWSGGDQGVTNDNCPAPGSPFLTENLGHACEAVGLTWRAYSENLAIIGSASCSYNGSSSSGLYTRKHDPWTQFSNLSHFNERPYTDLAADIAGGTLPNLVFVIPNNCHNSHNSSTSGCGIPEADTWLSNNLPAILTAIGPRGLLILTWDEDDSSTDNHILTVFSGGLVQPGASDNRHVTHDTVLRTISDALGLAPFGNAIAETPIDDVWVRPTVAQRASWGALKISYH